MKNTWLAADETKTVLELKADSTPEEMRHELKVLKNDYHEACKLIAQMHGAAIGEYGGGPKRGIVEDVEDLRTEVMNHRKSNYENMEEMNRLLAENDELKKQLAHALNHVSSLQDALTFGTKVKLEE